MNRVASKGDGEIDPSQLRMPLLAAGILDAAQVPTAASHVREKGQSSSAHVHMPRGASCMQLKMVPFLLFCTSSLQFYVFLG